MDIFWDKYYWLPSTVEWSDLNANRTDINLPQPGLIYACFFYGFAFLFLRAFCHCIIALPIANFIGLNKVRAENNKSQTLIADWLQLIFTDYPDRPKVKKFADSCWRFLFYCVSFGYGLRYMIQEYWAGDFLNCWYGYPNHNVSDKMVFHYTIECSYYWSALWVTLVNYKRKDFLINTVHHLVTLWLMWFSWALNFTRVGVLILVIHDAADVWIELGKMLRYAFTSEIYVNTIFAIFILVWAVSRLYVFPQLIWSGIVDGQLVVASYHFPISVILLLCLLVVLQILHIIWSLMIVRMVINSIKYGKTEDARSDSDDSDSD